MTREREIILAACGLPLAVLLLLIALAIHGAP